MAPGCGLPDGHGARQVSAAGAPELGVLLFLAALPPQAALSLPCLMVTSFDRPGYF